MTTVDYDDEDFKELIPRGLPKDFDTYHPMRMRGVDYLVAKTNDGRLDLREITSNMKSLSPRSEAPRMGGAS